jgi:drug/metabolite transporter (DMT)-like permease
LNAYTGEIAALLVAIFWTITALAFEYASVRVGSLAVNMIRLLYAIVFLTIFTSIQREMPLPLDAGPRAWFWLSLSGFVGFVLGDLFLFKSYTIVGSRISMLVMTLVPPITALFGWMILDEKLTTLNFIGMLLTFSGIVMAVVSRNRGKDKSITKLSLKGLLFAFGGAVGQAVGLVLSKLGMGSYNAFSATEIRIFTGIIGFGLIILIFGKMNNIKVAFRHKQSAVGILIGSFFGPFLGVSLSLYAVQHANTGVAATIMAMVPIFIILPSVLVFKQKITLLEILGAVISVGGVALFFL